MRRFKHFLFRIGPTIGPIQSRLLLGTLFLFALVTPIPKVAAQSCVAPPSGLVSWWPGEGNANDIADDNDGTLQNEATFAPGMVGQAFSLDGVDDGVQVADSAGLDITTAVTIDTWIKPATVCPAFCLIVAKSNFAVGIRNYGLWTKSNDGLHLSYVSGGVNIALDTPGGLITPGIFRHVAGVIDPVAGFMKIFVDGVEVATRSTTAPLVANNVPLTIGFPQLELGDVRHFNGLIDEVEIFNRALSASELEAIFNAGTAGKCKTDHFLCYKAKTTLGTEKFLPVSGVTLTDQFGTETVEVKKVKSLCNPAEKNGEEITDPETHLKGYQIKPDTAHVPVTGIIVKNQFHPDGLSYDTIKPDRLLVPSAKCVDDPPGSCPPTLPLPDSEVDHFKCYKVKVTPGTPKLPKGIQASVKDQFNEVAKLFDIKKPSRLCNPVEKTVDGDVTEIKNPDAHLMCYKAKPATKHTPATGIHVNNQFGPEQLDTIKEEELCVPSTKIQPGP